MITLSKIRDLDLSMATSPGRNLHLSAASGLVFADRHFYVVADDEFHLGVFDVDDSRPGTLIRLFAGELPDDTEERKARKPDLETLMQVPPCAGYPHGALLALGSGSKRKRRRGALLVLDAQGQVRDAPRVIDLSALFLALDDHVNGLNIEGGFVNGDELQLLQRGNKRDGRNALIRFSLSALFDLLAASDDSGHIAPLAIHSVDLGSIAGTPLCFTDGAVLPNGDVVFSAVAESTDDTYSDGPCLGAAIGMLDREGKLLCLHRLDRRHKIEGIDARLEGDLIRLHLVTDGDDANVSASLFGATFPRP